MTSNLRPTSLRRARASSPLSKEVGLKEVSLGALVGLLIIVGIFGAKSFITYMMSTPDTLSKPQALSEQTITSDSQATVSNATALVTTTASTANDLVTGRPRLFVIKSANSEIYLFGTPGDVRIDEGFMDARLFQAFDSADEVWFDQNTEIREIKETRLYIESQFKGRGLANQETLSQQDINELYTFLAQDGMTPTHVAHLNTSYLALLLAQKSLSIKGISEPKGVEKILLKRSASFKKAVKYFETPRQKALSWAQYLRRAQAPDLKTMVELNHGLDQDALSKAWQAGDVEQVEALLEPQRVVLGEELSNLIISNRARAYMPRLMGMMNSGSRTFIVLNQAMLVGPNGLIAQLRAKGIVVKSA